MNYTEKHHLPQWESADRVLRSDFNSAMQTIDTSLAACGNCKIVMGSYTGDGNASKSPTLTFDAKPILVFFFGGGYTLWLMHGQGNFTMNYINTATPIAARWENNSVYWWYGGNEHTAAQMLNENGTGYAYVAFLQV